MVPLTIGWVFLGQVIIKELYPHALTYIRLHHEDSFPQYFSVILS